MDGLIERLGELPIGVVYLVMTLVSALENVFPPVPADTVVAFGSWLAARGEGSVVGALLATSLGNVAGAAGMYAVGRRHGSTWMRRHFPSIANDEGEARLKALYGKYGMAALVVSRFIPGVRALVPPFAGALRIPATPAIAAMAVASFVWYGMIAYVAFTAGSEWSVLQARMARWGTIVAVVSGVILALGVAIWFLRRRRSAT